jgi:hypothetical protein
MFVGKPVMTIVLNLQQAGEGSIWFWAMPNMAQVLRTSFAPTSRELAAESRPRAEVALATGVYSLESCRHVDCVDLTAVVRSYGVKGTVCKTMGQKSYAQWRTEAHEKRGTKTPTTFLSR